MTLPDYPEDPLHVAAARAEARDEAIEARRDELLADRSEQGYCPWTGRNVSEAIGEMNAVQLDALGDLQRRGAYLPAGLALRNHILAYWTELATNKAVHEIDSEHRRRREDAAADKWGESR